MEKGTKRAQQNRGRKTAERRKKWKRKKHHEFIIKHSKKESGITIPLSAFMGPNTSSTGLPQTTGTVRGGWLRKMWRWIKGRFK